MLLKDNIQYFYNLNYISINVFHFQESSTNSSMIVGLAAENEVQISKIKKQICY